MPTGRFEGQVAFVTGASRGIGRAIAQAFAREGAGVGLISADGSGAKAVADEISAAGGRALPLACDVAVEEEVRRAVAQAERTLGPVDILVNNAAIPGPTLAATEISLEEWRRVLDVNLTGTFLCTREMLRGMVARAQQGARPGRIVNIGSIAGKLGYPLRSPYASSKWALIGFTLTVAEEVGRLGIRVNCVCPGPVQTELLDRVIAARAESMGLPAEKVRERFIAFTMLKRMIQPDEVASVVLFLASDAAAGITGQALDVAGGWATLQT